MTDFIEESVEETKLSKDDVINERRKRVLALHHRGTSLKDIATGENVSIQTVKRDISISQAEGIKEVKNYNSDQFIAIAVSQYDDIWTACWKIHNDNSTDPELQLKAMTAARLCLNDKSKLVQSTGLVKKDLQLTGLQVNMNLVAGMTDEEIRDITREIINKQALTTELLMPEPEDIEEAEIVTDIPLEPELDE
jgi:hypothetical protein